ncbi:phytoene/squalene synthase family protein [Halomarina ordinaria]|uniref:Phytoene/squalene synthase family protein n=1 Tax=Halomarina ordinaria TaxID=3033939 RepID=A0ABD5UDX1_9EURY|nr:phytoene/squalene synthase family protein [Halomarina sp. PSRA2]
MDDVSRTFAITIDLLDAPMSDYICVGYLLCRVPDTVEDAGHVPPAEKARLLRTYDDALDPASATGVDDFRAAVEEWLPADPDAPADWAVVRHADRVFAAYDAFDADVRAAMRPPIRELVGGMATFVEGSDAERGIRIGTREELDRYCYVVAGTVGHLITNLAALDTDDETERYLRARAESFGHLLQLVNIAKDVHTDYREEDNVYIPREWLQAHGVPIDELLAPEHRTGATAALQRVIDHARSFRTDAREYLERYAHGTDHHLGAWAVPYLLAIATLRELEGNLEDVFTESSVKVSREEVARVVSAFAVDSPDLSVLDGVERSVETA